MKTKNLKSWKTLSEESKIQRKANLTSEQIEKLNKTFAEIEKLQQEKDDSKKESDRKIARQPEV